MESFIAERIKAEVKRARAEEEWETLSAWERNRWRYFDRVVPLVETFKASEGFYRYDGVELSRDEATIAPSFVGVGVDAISFIAVHFLAKKYKGAFITVNLRSRVCFHFPSEERPSKDELCALLLKIEKPKQALVETLAETISVWDEKEAELEKEEKMRADLSILFNKLLLTANVERLIEHLREFEKTA